MTAFDRAWNLMKMPLLPYSLKDKGDMKWEGIFEGLGGIFFARYLETFSLISLGTTPSKII